MKLKKIIKFSIITSSIFFLLILIAIMIYISITISSVKNIDLNIANDKYKISTFYSDSGNLINYNNHNKYYTKIREIPDYTKEAFLSIEDKDFYNHNGLNYKRIVGATINNIRNKDFSQGASTITQQLIKNKFLTNEKTLNRKIKEAYLSLKLEKNESKDNILESYLNTIYFGNGAYGIGEASIKYFNKATNELDLNESCVLAGLIKSPTYYSPINNLDKCIVRRNLVLSEMLEDNKITEKEYNENISKEIIVNLGNIVNNNDYIEFALDECSNILNISPNEILNRGYKIYTYQNNFKQNILDNYIKDEKNYGKNSYDNISDSLSIMIDNKTYGVSAISSNSKYNLVNTKRQPGSLIKPIMVFAPAIDNGLIYSCSEILDEEIDFNGYKPRNVGNKYYGYIGVKDIIAKSLNIPTVKICEKLGFNNAKKFASNCGIEFHKSDNGYATTLGGLTEGITLKDITDSYSIFTSQGNYIQSAFVSKIEDEFGNVIYSRNMSYTPVIGTDTAYIMSDSLHYAVHNGTSKKLSNFDFDIAGKTGTVAIPNSNLNSDSYSLAYTTEDTISVWIGNYSMNPKYHLEANNNGGTYATQIITSVFKDVYCNDTPTNFAIPDTVTYKYIDEKTLEENHMVVLGNNIPDRYKRKELFSNRFIPSEESTKFNNVSPFDFKISNLNNSVIFEFETYDYLEYNIYKNNSLIYTIDNKNGYQKYVDTDIQENTQYEYYVIAKSLYSDSKYTTPKKKIYLSKDYNKLLSNNDNSSWLFS